MLLTNSVSAMQNHLKVLQCYLRRQFVKKSAFPTFPALFFLYVLRIETICKIFPLNAKHGYNRILLSGEFSDL